MTSISFACGHGAPPAEASARVGRRCPLCALIREQQRSRDELLRRVVPSQRATLAAETRIGAEYEWRCNRGHDRYRASILAALSADGCPKCAANALSPSGRLEHGVPRMKANLKLGTSMAEHKLKALLAERIAVPHKVNSIRIARTFHGRTEVWPDIILPALKIAIEYDSPGKRGSWHLGLKEASDIDKDAALREVGWEVIRVRTGGLEPLTRFDIVAPGPSGKVVEQILERIAEIRGSEALKAALNRAESGD